jgi:hypothetical protein
MLNNQMVYIYIYITLEHWNKNNYNYIICLLQLKDGNIMDICRGYDGYSDYSAKILVICKLWGSDLVDITISFQLYLADLSMIV